VKKKLLVILGIIIAIPLISFTTLVLYFIITDDNSSTADSSVSQKNEIDNSNNKQDEKYENTQVIINDVDVSSKIKVKEIDNIKYANAKSFIESFVESDMKENMHYFNFRLIEDRDEIETFISEYSYEKGEYLDEKYAHLLDLKAILVTSWFTDAELYMLFIDSTDVIKFNVMEEKEYTTIDEAPRIIDNIVYIPMEAFANIVGSKVEIKD